MLRDEAFNNKWLLYKMDFADNKFFVIWLEFLNNILNRSFPDIYDELSRTPIWLEKRFGISNKRVSHSNVIFGKDYLTETTLNNHDVSGNLPSLTKEQVKSELEAWTPRNLNIFFLELVIANEIAVLEHPGNTQINTLISDAVLKETKQLEHYYKNILRAVNDAHFDCFEATAIHTVNAAHISRYDVDAEFEAFKIRDIYYLQQLLTAEEFYKLRETLQSGRLYTNDYHGIMILGAKPPQMDPPTYISPEKKAETPPAAPPPASPIRTIGIAIAIGVLLGLLTVGIATAIIFSGGTAAILSTAIICMLVAASTLTGIGLNACRNKQTMTTALIQRQIRNKNSPGEVVTTTSPSNSSSTEPLTIIKSQPPQGEPYAQNLSPSSEPVRNATPH